MTSSEKIEGEDIHLLHRLNQASSDVSGEILTDSDGEKIIKSFVDTFSLVKHQIESFNYFYTILCPKIIQFHNPVEHKSAEGKYEIYFSNFVCRPPMYKDSSQEFRRSMILYPNEARAKNCPYTSQMYIDIEVIYPSGHVQRNDNHYIGELPVMLRSSLCHTCNMTTEELYNIKEDPYDPGGYFILGSKKGTSGERVLLCQEGDAFNKIILMVNRKSQKSPKYTHYAEIKSSNPLNEFVSTTVHVGIFNRLISVGIPWIPDKNAIPMGIIFIALGIKQEDIAKFIFNSKELKDIELVNGLIPSLEQTYNIREREEALEYIGKTGKLFSSKGKETTQEEEDDEDTEIDQVLPDLSLSSAVESVESDDIPTKNKEKSSKSKISEDAISYATFLLESQFFPHVGKNKVKKALYFGHVVNKLIKFYIRGNKDKTISFLRDRDHYSNKRIRTPAELLGSLFNQAFSKAIREMKMCCIKRTSTSGGRTINPGNFFRSEIFTKYFSNSLINNRWGCSKTPSKNGISQIFERFNMLMMISQRRRINTQFSQEGKLTEPRRLHLSSYGFICSSETPEGKQTGLVKSLGILSSISIGSSPHPIIDIIKGLDQVIKRASGIDGFIKHIDDLSISSVEGRASPDLESSKILVNGSWEFITNSPLEVVEQLEKLQSADQLAHDVSVVYEKITDEINIHTDSGRLNRLLFSVKNNKLNITKEDIKGIKEGKINVTDLISSGKILIVCPEKQSSSATLIALNHEELCKNTDPSLAKSRDLGQRSYPALNYTHCEIHSNSEFGFLASIIPYNNHNQSPRNTYECAMCKQAIGIPGLNYFYRDNSSQYILDYPQKPLVDSRISEIIDYPSLPCGGNVIVAIMPYQGFNQEDSIILNMNSVQRGLFNTTFYSHHYTQLRSFSEKEREFLEIPTTELCQDITGKVTDSLCTDKLITDQVIEDNEIRININEYKEVVSRGGNVPYAVAKVGSIIRRGDIIIGILKQNINYNASSSNGLQKPYKNNSIVYNEFDCGQVVKVVYGTDWDGFFFVNVKIAAIRIPEIGDKFSSRCGQKATCGLMISAENMPFSPDPYSAPVPDMIINPLCIPSRMTIGQLIETLMAKKITVTDKKRWTSSEARVSTSEARASAGFARASANKDRISGKNYKTSSYKKIKKENNSTPFVKLNLEEKIKELSSLGYDGFGNQILYSGITGEPIHDCFIFMGPVFYQRLKHLGSNKMHARGDGPLQGLNRQPTEGRARDGGLRIGEMERDCMISHGVSRVVRDSLCERSDLFETEICRICGHFAIKDDPVGCRICNKREDNIVTIQIPYAMKLTSQYLIGINMVPRLLVD